MKSMSNSKRVLFRTGFYTIGTLLVALWLVPILIAIFTSLKSMDEIMSSPRMWAPPKVAIFANFAEVWTKVGMARYVLNTFIITIPSVVGALLISSLGAFALAFYRFRLNKTVLIIFITGMLIPFQMLLIPVYRFPTPWALSTPTPALFCSILPFN